MQNRDPVVFNGSESKSQQKESKLIENIVVFNGSKILI